MWCWPRISPAGATSPAWWGTPHASPCSCRSASGAETSAAGRGGGEIAPLLEPDAGDHLEVGPARPHHVGLALFEVLAADQGVVGIGVADDHRAGAGRDRRGQKRAKGGIALRSAE